MFCYAWLQAFYTFWNICFGYAHLFATCCYFGLRISNVGYVGMRCNMFWLCSAKLYIGSSRCYKGYPFGFHQISTDFFVVSKGYLWGFPWISMIFSVLYKGCPPQDFIRCIQLCNILQSVLLKMSLDVRRFQNMLQRLHPQELIRFHRISFYFTRGTPEVFIRFIRGNTF